MDSDLRSLLSRDLRSSDGARLGHVADVYVDAASGAAKWLVVRGGLLSSGVTFVPADGARQDDEGRVVVGYTRRQVRRAPHPPADGELDVDEEATLARYYLDLAAARTTTRLPDDVPTPGEDDTVQEWLADPRTTSDDSLVRAEEEVEVDTAPRPARRARLVKTVVTEEVTIKVPLRREVLRLVHEDVDPSEAEVVALADGREPFAPIADHEVVLYAEIVEYEKKVVPKERVRLQQDVVPGEIDLRTDVRKEQVDLLEVPGI
jgi:stress response protein YsnF